MGIRSCVRLIVQGVAKVIQWVKTELYNHNDWDSFDEYGIYPDCNLLTREEYRTLPPDEIRKREKEAIKQLYEKVEELDD